MGKHMKLKKIEFWFKGHPYFKKVEVHVKEDINDIPSIFSWLDNRIEHAVERMKSNLDNLTSEQLEELRKNVLKNSSSPAVIKWVKGLKAKEIKHGRTRSKRKTLSRE
jgi:MarR-like DNA-binding transcriptional regulator SgrR of sgrS sRNA